MLISRLNSIKDYGEDSNDTSDLQNLIDDGDAYNLDYVPPDILNAIVGPYPKVYKKLKRKKNIHHVTNCVSTGTGTTENVNNTVVATVPLSSESIQKLLNLLSIRLKEAGIDSAYLELFTQKGAFNIEYFIQLLRQEEDIYDATFQEIIKQRSLANWDALPDGDELVMVSQTNTLWSTLLYIHTEAPLLEVMGEQKNLLITVQQWYTNMLGHVSQCLKRLLQEILAFRKVVQSLQDFNCLENVLSVIKKAITQNEEERALVKRLQEEQVENKLARNMSMLRSLHHFLTTQQLNYEKQIETLTQKCVLWQNCALELSSENHYKHIIAILNEWEMHMRYAVQIIRQLNAENNKDHESESQYFKEEVENELSRLCIDLTAVVCTTIKTENKVNLAPDQERDLISRLQEITKNLTDSSKRFTHKSTDEQYTTTITKLMHSCVSTEKSSYELIESFKRMKYVCSNNIEAKSHKDEKNEQFKGNAIPFGYNTLQNEQDKQIFTQTCNDNMNEHNESSLYEALETAMKKLGEAEARADVAENRILRLEMEIELLKRAS